MDSSDHKRHGSVEMEMKKDQLRHPKKLIVCCDGTWMDSDNGYVDGKLQNPSNVTRISRAIKPEDSDHSPQIVYYQAGIGTGLGLYDRYVGGGTGLGLSENIREAYAFLAANYQAEYSDHDKVVTEADSIFLLGFSRGAFTARSLGGFIGAVGILTKRAIPYFYHCFLDWENAMTPSRSRFFDAFAKDHPEIGHDLEVIQEQLKLAQAEGVDDYMKLYRKHLSAFTLTQETKIKAIGVWDTVGALGIPVNPIFQRLLGLPAFIHEFRWFDTRLDDCVENAFQALALDERRAPYSPAVWQQSKHKKTNLKQVWFPGAHSNVGGSYEDYGTANITLAWMMDQLSGKSRKLSTPFRSQDWIQFEDDFIDICFRRTQHYYQKHGSILHRGWAMGRLYESCHFPQSLVGSRTRTPGMYRKTDCKTGRYTKELLHDTHEYIHSSVRARVDLAGPGVEPIGKVRRFLSWIWCLVTFQDQNLVYRPAKHPTWLERKGPLYGWQLVDGHPSHHEPNGDIDMSPHGIKEVHWQYVGTGLPCQDSMEEDLLAEGGYEEQLLGYHEEAVVPEIIVSNNKWQRRTLPPKQHRLARTF